MRRRFALLLACAVALTAAAYGGEDDTSVGSESASYDVELPEGWVEATDAQKEQSAQQVGAVVDEATDG